MLLDHALIPLDGSEATDELLTWARSLIHSEGKVSLVRIIKEPTYTGCDSARMAEDEKVERRYIQRELQEATVYLVRIAETIRASGLKHIGLHVKTGNPAKIIVDVARELQADVIVLSTRDRNGFHQWLLESTAVMVLRNASCPVVILPICKEAGVR
jgi:nucleotide-binding universal stress UspA family protein